MISSIKTHKKHYKNKRDIMKEAYIFNNKEIMIKEMICILLLFPVTQQYPLEKKDSVLSESRLQYASPFRRNFIPSTTPYHLTKAHPLRRKSRNVFKLPNDVFDGRGGHIHKSEHSSKSKLNKQVSSNGIYKSRNVFKFPNNNKKTKRPNVWKTRGPIIHTTKEPNIWKTKRPNVWKTRGPNVWKTREPNVWKTRGPIIHTTKEPNIWKTKGPTVLTTKGPNVWKTSGPNVRKTRGPNVLITKGPNMWITTTPIVRSTETFTHDNIKATSSTSSNVLKTKVPNVQPYDKIRNNESAPNLSQTIEYEKHNIGMVAGSIVIVVTLGIAAFVVYNVKCLRQRMHVFSICTSSNEQSRTITNKIPYQNDTERQLIKGQRETISVGI